MKILAIDPGYDRLGIAVVDGTPSSQKIVWSGCIIPPKGTPAERLFVVANAVSDAISSFSPNAIAIETLFFGVNKKTAIGVAEARGVVLSLAGRFSLPVIECSPQEVKCAVTGSGKADKAAVSRMIPMLVSLPHKKRTDDELDAIAIGICAISIYRG